MAEIKPFSPVKLICGIISSEDRPFRRAEERLAALFGAVDSRSPRFEFDLTDYYETQMGKALKRGFLSFDRLIDPAGLSEIKIRTNALEKEIQREFKEDRRVVNLDPGYITPAALIMATAKDFSHRIPLQNGIYGHLEFLFTRTGIRRLGWTYPDFANEGYQKYFLDLRRRYRDQLKGA
ncbi:MAG: DUF4416 family protein [Candidatus Aminicenantes bacterium]|nr:DUF4416 family protein [Candidatus Aminicenantes bacterium]